MTTAGLARNLKDFRYRLARRSTQVALLEAAVRQGRFDPVELNDAAARLERMAVEFRQLATKVVEEGVR